MRNVHFLLWCVALAGCSRGGVSSVPIAFERTATHRFEAPLGELTRHAYKFKSLYSFKGFSDGAFPVARLTAVNGALYGTTQGGGVGRGCGRVGCGTVFKLTTAGVKTVLHSFTGYQDGLYPQSRLLDVDGILYGTVGLGGVRGCGGLGCGTAFTITTSGEEHVLHKFGSRAAAGTSDGANPSGALVDVDGTLLGTTGAGGAGCLYCGTVFKISPSGAENVLYSFKGPPSDSEGPGELTDVNGTLFGTAGGGPGNLGTVFKIAPSGVESMIYAFKGPPSDGYGPDGATLVNIDGTLYGATYFGGAASCGCGTVFAITPAGAERVLYSFTGGADGSGPFTSPIAVGGKLYGTASGGANPGCHVRQGCGTVFELTTSGSMTVLHSFTRSEGGVPYGGLIDVNGTLYGTTYYGGSSGSCGGEGNFGCGTVFSLTL